MRSLRLTLLVSTWFLTATAGVAASPLPDPPNILIITIDTLRPDRMSGYGYDRLTSPNLDRLMDEGVRFTQARTVVPLTCPGLASMITTLEPHEHGATRNGIPMAEGLPSFTKDLAARGYTTAAVVSNWTLKNDLCGLAEHFSSWTEVLNRKRWLFGKKHAEARAGDVTAQALEWLRDFNAKDPETPFLLWVHYVDPHSPYTLNGQYLKQLGLKRLPTMTSQSKRYDTEIAAVDDSVGDLLEEARSLTDPSSLLIVFTSDHGESLGHHGYWGHGRHVYEASLQIPMSFTWEGRLDPDIVEAPALNIDVAPSVMALAGFELPETVHGFDWSGVLERGSAEPMNRVTFHQAHRGTVDPEEDRQRVRQRGLLEVCRIDNWRKEVFVVHKDAMREFDLTVDVGERSNLASLETTISDELSSWLDEVRRSLESTDDQPPPLLDEDTYDRLEALGYTR